MNSVDGSEVIGGKSQIYGIVWYYSTRLMITQNKRVWYSTIIVHHHNFFIVPYST